MNAVAATAANDGNFGVSNTTTVMSDQEQNELNRVDSRVDNAAVVMRENLIMSTRLIVGMSSALSYIAFDIASKGYPAFLLPSTLFIFVLCVLLISFLDGAAYAKGYAEFLKENYESRTQGEFPEPVLTFWYAALALFWVSCLTFALCFFGEFYPFTNFNLSETTPKI